MMPPGHVFVLFPQAGDKVRAMKALIQSRDTEKITFFAGEALPVLQL